jgi:Rieske Fe-S protein
MNHCLNCSRRKFIGGLASAFGVWSSLVAAPASSPDAGALDPERLLRLNLNTYTGLEKPGDSVILTHDAGGTVLLVNRGPNDTFHVLDPTCAHQGCRVDRYSAASGAITCPCHGSGYGIDGSLRNGPATGGLNRYSCSYRAGILEIAVPGLKFGITTQSLVNNSAGAERIALTFLVQPGSSYALRRGIHVAGPFLSVPFSLTRDGTLNQTRLTGNGSESPKTIYADASGQRGFFLLELLIFEIN